MNRPLRDSLSMLAGSCCTSGYFAYCLWDVAPFERMLVAQSVQLSFLIWWAIRIVICERRARLADDPDELWYRHGVTVFVAGSLATCVQLFGVFTFASEALAMLGMVVLISAVFMQALGTVRMAHLGDPGWIARWVPAVVPVAIVLFQLLHGGAHRWIVILFVSTVSFQAFRLRGLMESALDESHLAKREVEAQIEAKTRFLVSAGHDLGQPLQSARLFFDQAMRGQDPAQRAVAATGAKNAMGAMARQLGQMLDHLRLESGAVEPHMAALDAGAVIGRVVAQFDPVAALAGVDLRAVPSRLVVHADPDLLERALGNLVDNALRHADARRVLAGARRHSDRVRLWVIDDGRGVSAADQQRMFEDYVQGADRAGRERGGFGLGLASVRRLLALMRGDAGLDVRWTRGSAFYLELPGAAVVAVSEIGR